MADPFSIISLVVTAVKTINVAKNYVETICRAPQSVAFLSKDLAEIESLLRQIGHISQGERNNERELYPILAGPIASCETVSNELHKVINPWVKKSSGMKVWSRFAYGFKESDVLLLSTKMASCKQNLTLAVNSATLLTSQRNGRGIRRMQRHMGIETSSVASEDIYERTYEHIERWNMDTETVVEEEIENTLVPHSQQASQSRSEIPAPRPFTNDFVESPMEPLPPQASKSRLEISAPRPSPQDIKIAPVVPPSPDIAPLMTERWPSPGEHPGRRIEKQENRMQTMPGLPLTRQKTYECEKCNKEFSSSIDRKWHHCEMAGKESAYMALLNLSGHPKKHNCKRCDQGFASQRDCDGHRCRVVEQEAKLATRIADATDAATCMWCPEDSPDKFTAQGHHVRCAARPSAN